MTILRLVYYSRNRLPSSADIDGEIEKILAVSRRNNARVGVTGALIFNTGCFGQVLEGSPEAVEATFERIQQDERHGEVNLLGVTQVATRAFASWSMGFVGASSASQRRFTSLAGLDALDPASLSGDRVFEALHRLALEEEAAAA